MAKKKAVKRKEKKGRIHRPNKSKLWEVKDGKVVRLNRSCPRCGEGVYLAKHYNRTSCGACGYTKFDSPTGKASTQTTTVGGVETRTRRRRIQR
ncbi:MAG: 30S ribosomal protein S27ae [Promethearchaeota archaeon]|nr:MAG: 30S ribosomal protein S27ae [Candidatus Lokiarchaeota archaeon]